MVLYNNLLAQTPKDLGPLKGLGPLGEFIPTEEDPGTTVFTKFLSTFVGIMTVIAFIWFLYNIFMGAIAWIGSEGDKAKLQSAQKRITHAIVGLIIVISALFIIRIIGAIFDIDLLNIGNFITKIFENQ